MEKNKILESARKNSNRGKEYENLQSTRADLLCTIISFAIGIFLLLLEGIINHTINLGLLSLLLSACATQNLFEGIKLKKMHQIIFGVIWAFASIISIAIFIVKLV